MAEPYLNPGESNVIPMGGTSQRNQSRDPGIDENRLINALEANLVEADTIQGSEISFQREQNHIAYAGTGFDERRGRSHHVSMDVLDSVESQKAYYMEAFSDHRRPMRFLPENRQDFTYMLGTEYVTDQFWEKNNGEEFLEDTLHDAMVAKRCVAKVEWKEEYEERQVQIVVPRQQVMAVSMQPNVVEVQEAGEVAPGQVSLLVTVEDDMSFSEICAVQPERYYRDPNVSRIANAAYAGHQEDFARYELIEDGYDPEEVMGLRLDYRFRQNEEDTARKAHDSSWARARRSKRQPEQEIVTIYHHYAFLDLSNFGANTANPSIAGAKLYKFVWSQGELLTLPETMDDDGNGEKWIVVEDGMPYFEWVQYKIAHAEFGLCEADLQTDIQKTKSDLRRLIIDNAAMGNTSRWKAKHNHIKNPRELLDNNIGSVLWVKTMDSLEPLETPPLSPISFQVLETMDIEKENRTGLSRLAKGMNTDALSHQNAETMIQRLTNASNRRVLKGVRSYATNFLKPIYQHVYNLGRKYDNTPQTLTVKGQMVQVQPTSFPPRKKLRIQTALTPDEGREQSYFMLALHDRWAGDPGMKSMYGDAQKYSMMNSIMDQMDVEGAHEYLMNPGSPEYAQMKQMEQQMQQMQQQLSMMKPMLDMQEQRRKQDKTDADIANIASDNLRDDDKFVHEVWKDRQEIKIEREQARPSKIGDGR